MIVPEPDRAHISKTVSDRGLDLEDLREDTRSPTWTVTVVVDGDSGVSLDDLAELSATLDPLAETWGGPGQAVTLEVTSRGVGAPLSEPRHWRRARGRQADLTYVDGAKGPTRGRIGDLAEDSRSVRLVSKSNRGINVDSVALDSVSRAVIRIEFSPAPQDELDLLAESDGSGRGAREGENK